MAQLEVARDGSVLIVTMNRPKRKNAMTLTMFALMDDAWKTLSHDDDLRCAILTGAEGNFSSGMDLRAMAGDVDPDGAIDEQARLREDPGFIMRGLLKTYRPTKPVLAAVEGVAIAGGTEILQGTDIRVAGESARFGVSEARWSLYPMGGSAVRLQRQIPYTVAAEILLTGRHITASEARDVGLVGHVVPDGQALDKARELAAAIAANGPLAVEAILKTLHETAHMSEDDAFTYESAYTNAVMASEDAKEGPRAFAEKRAANFQRR
ncbi:MAG TPA: crotonase/enoyl-CoA hydratase family protein [Acidimicrobiales bacterium]|nr:crotonase/enoyl-CoA hydratase family protein [Acidimicrobiales bacterium]